MVAKSRMSPSQQDPGMIRDWFSTLKLGEPAVSGNLIVYTITADKNLNSLKYLPLPDALAKGTVSIEESDHATVPILTVINNGFLPILILDGEEIIGGLQNRVLNTTVLVPANSKIDIPVSCVEHGRWQQSSPNFSQGEPAYPSLRRMKAEQVSEGLQSLGSPIADQRAIWNEIAQSHHRSGTKIHTGAMNDVYGRYDSDIRAVARSFPNAPEGAIGVLACLNGNPICADIFDTATSLAVYWKLLVRSYIIEEKLQVSCEVHRISANIFLQRLTYAQFKAFTSPGMGVDLRISDPFIAGATLAYNGHAIHTVIFPKSRIEDDRSIRRPGDRRRAL